MSTALIIEMLLVLIIAQVIFVVIMENKNPYRALAWTLVLTFLPVLGLVLYLFFGEDYHRKRRIQKKLSVERQTATKSPEGDFELPFRGWGLAPFRGLGADAPEEYGSLSDMLRNTDDSVVLDGNEVRFYSDGADKFKQFFEDIANARHHVHVLYYKIIDDHIGNQFKDLAIKKAEEGVQVRVLYDDVGSLHSKKRFFNEMRRGGVEVEVFLNVRLPWLARSLNYRNHKKLAVIDGTIGYVGGMNIQDCYIEGVPWGVWRDMQIRIVGKGTQGLQRTFFLDWYHIHKSLPDYSPQYYPDTAIYGNNPMQIVSCGPLDDINSIERGIFQAISNAKKNVYLQTPYFVPSEGILFALQTAAISGVGVHVMMPKKSDNIFLDGANLSYVKDLLPYGIKVYLFNAGFLHSKCTVIDESLTIMGSANMDVRSFELDFETNAFIYDEDTARQAIDIFYTDAEDSLYIIEEEWKKRSFRQRLFQAVCRLMTPVL